MARARLHGRRPRCTRPAGATRPPRGRSRRPPGRWSTWPSGSTTRPAVEDARRRRARPRPGRRSRSCARRSATTPCVTDDDSRRLRTRGKSTPDLLRARSGDLADAPDAVVRPGDADEVAAVLAIAVRHHVAVVPFGGGTAVTGGLAPAREGFAGVLSLDLRPDGPAPDGRPGLDDGDPRARAARSRGRGAARRARPDPRPLPAVVRVRLDRRLRRDPLVGPVLGRLRPLRRDGRRSHGRDPDRAG